MKWIPTDEVIYSKAAMSLGAPIEAGKNLYTDLQKVYFKTKESYEQLRVRTEEKSSYEQLEKNAYLNMGYEYDYKICKTEPLL